jgi:hypothetical protein
MVLRSPSNSFLKPVSISRRQPLLISKTRMPAFCCVIAGEGAPPVPSALLLRFMPAGKAQLLPPHRSLHSSCDKSR